MLRWSCRKSGCAGCLSGSIGVGGVVGCWWEGSNAFSCVLIASVCRVRVHWVQTGALTIWRVSHTPHRQQCSGVRRSCWEMSQPLETAQPRLQQQQLCRPAEPRKHNNLLLKYQQAFFSWFASFAAGDALYQAFVYLSATEDDSSEKAPYILMWECLLIIHFGLIWVMHGDAF